VDGTRGTGDTLNIRVRILLRAEDDFRTAVLPRLGVVCEVVFCPAAIPHKLVSSDKEDRRRGGHTVSDLDDYALVSSSRLWLVIESTDVTEVDSGISEGWC
jgi:hypothetical protein